MRTAYVPWFAVLSALALVACGDDASGSGGAGGTTSSSTSSGGEGGGGGSGGAGGAGAGLDAAALLGTWKSNACEISSPMTSLRRNYVIAPEGVSIAFEQFAGGNCEAGSKLMTIHVEATTEIVGPSQVVPGAMEIVVSIQRKAVTPAAAGVDFLTGACGQYAWAADVEQDVTEDGCGMLLPSEAQCPAEYDLAALVDDVLYFGDRTNALCSEETRPTKLSAWGVVKQP